MLDIDNATLMQECRNGDRDAMSILYTRFAPRMLLVISRYVQDSDSAHDILHDGFIAAFTHLDTLRDPDRIEFWLASIMKNLSLKFLQAQSITSLLDEIGDIPASESDSSLDDILDFATLESLIRQLPEGYQKVFRLAVLENKSHKEISEILGIAPNSSSSQLFHAKLRLRQLIKDYRLRAGLTSLLLLMATGGLIYLSRRTDSLPNQGIRVTDAMPKRPVSSSDPQPEQVKENIPVKISVPSASYHSAYAATVSSNQAPLIADSDENISDTQLPTATEDKYAVNPDSIEVSVPADKHENHMVYPPDDGSDLRHDRLFAEMPGKVSYGEGWSAGMSVDPGTLSLNSLFNDDLKDLTQNRPWDTEQPPSGSDEDKEGSDIPSRMPRGPQGMESYLGSASPRHHMPVSFALTAEKRFSSWFGLESGIGYSYLHTDFERYNPDDRRTEVSTCHWHYLEIPLKVNLYAYTSTRMNVYFGFGGRVAIPVHSYAKIAPNPYCQSGCFGSKAVWSAGGSVGASFRLSKRIDLFVEPTLRYHFPQDCRIPNIWTDDEPWTLSIPIGFRFSW